MLDSTMCHGNGVTVGEYDQVWYGNGDDDDDDDDAGTGSDIMLSGQLGRSSACVSLCVTFSLLPPPLPPCHFHRILGWLS